VQRALQVEGIRQIDRGVDSLPRLATRRRSEESSLTRQPAPTKPRSISHLVRWLPPSLIPFLPGFAIIAGKGWSPELRIPRNIVVTPGRAFRIGGLVP
jgi:hypothetical protein